jgi:hypothetical protein
MRNVFVQPIFTGARFDDHTLPVDAARDLPAYEALLIELAKHLYLQAHPERQRVPKGFSDARLAIASVGEGSAMPELVLATVIANTTPLFENVNPYYEQARDLIAECIDAPEAKLPERFPRELLSYFNHLGRSLKEGESLEFRLREQTRTAVLNPEKRKKLVLAANKVYEREVDLIGLITETDYDKSTFRLRLLEGNHAVIAPMPEEFREGIRQAGGRERFYVAVKGVATYDSWDHIQKVVTIDTLEVVRNYPLVARFDELAQLEDGWYDGEGLAPDRENFDHFAQRFSGFYPEQIPLPAIVPKQDGGILLEWNADGDPSVDVDLRAGYASFHAFGRQDEDVEADFDLGDDNAWERFWTFLSSHIQARTV